MWRWGRSFDWHETLPRRIALVGILLMLGVFGAMLMTLALLSAVPLTQGPLSSAVSSNPNVFVGVTNLILTGMLVVTTIGLYRVERDRDRARFRVLDGALRTNFKSGEPSFYVRCRVANAGAPSSVERVTVRIGKPWKTWKRFRLKVGSPLGLEASPRLPMFEYVSGTTIARGEIVDLVAHFGEDIGPNEIHERNGQTCRLFVKPLLGEAREFSFPCDSGLPSISGREGDLAGDANSPPIKK